LVPRTRRNGEQREPVVVSTPSGSHAMGVFTPEPAPAGQPPVGYGSFEFPEAKVVKWNCVFRRRQAEPIPAGRHVFQLYVVIGTKEDCRRALVDLAREFPAR
jgi:hypothetical protein